MTKHEKELEKDLERRSLDLERSRKESRRRKNDKEELDYIPKINIY